MNQTLYTLSLALVVLAVLVNRGNGNRTHQAIQLFLTTLVLVSLLAALGQA